MMLEFQKLPSMPFSVQASHFLYLIFCSGNIMLVFSQCPNSLASLNWPFMACPCLSLLSPPFHTLGNPLCSKKFPEGWGKMEWDATCKGQSLIHSGNQRWNNLCTFFPQPVRDMKMESYLLWPFIILFYDDYCYS